MDTLKDDLHIMTLHMNNQLKLQELFCVDETCASCSFDEWYLYTIKQFVQYPCYEYGVHLYTTKLYGLYQP